MLQKLSSIPLMFSVAMYLKKWRAICVHFEKICHGFWVIMCQHRFINCNKCGNCGVYVCSSCGGGVCVCACIQGQESVLDSFIEFYRGKLYTSLSIPQ